MRTVILATALLAGSAVAAPADNPWHAKARELFKQAIETPTVAGRGKVPELAQYLAGQYKAAGWADSDIHVSGGADRVRRYRRDIPEAEAQGDRGLHHRSFRVMARPIH